MYKCVDISWRLPLLIGCLCFDGVPHSRSSFLAEFNPFESSLVFENFILLKHPVRIFRLVLQISKDEYASHGSINAAGLSLCHYFQPGEANGQ